MARLVYWVSERHGDSSVYNLRAKTKKECIALRSAAIASGMDDDDFGAVHKVSVEYADAFDLMQRCMGESRRFLEYSA